MKKWLVTTCKANAQLIRHQILHTAVLEFLQLSVYIGSRIFTLAYIYPCFCGESIQFSQYYWSDRKKMFSDLSPVRKFHVPLT